MTTDTLLNIRAVLSIVMFITTLVGAFMLLSSRRNGITHILGLTAIFASLYIANVIFISLIDVIEYPNVRYWDLVAWNIITFFLVGSIILLGIKLLRDKDG